MKTALIDLATILPADLIDSPTAVTYVMSAAMGQGIDSYEHVAGKVYRVWASTDGALSLARRAAESAGHSLAAA